MKIKINDTLTFEAASVVDNLTEESREQVRAAVLQQFGLVSFVPDEGRERRRVRLFILPSQFI